MPAATDNTFSLADLDYFKLFSQKEHAPSSVLVQEDAGFHLGISPDLEQAGQHAARVFKEHYDSWVNGGWEGADSAYKHSYFTVAVGGGNTVKAVFKALLESHSDDIEWLKYVRFFFLEASSGESKWESARKSLEDNLIAPLFTRYLRKQSRYSLTDHFDLPENASDKELFKAFSKTMVHGFHLGEIKKALRNGDASGARKLARKKAQHYLNSLREKLGENYAFHQIISGIGKDGGFGAFTPYTPALQNTDPDISLLTQPSGAIRLALNRGILVNADQVHLIIAGSLKLRALGRFEMEDSGNFEQSVLETPIRMLRQSRKLAEKVYIFADDRALHFDEETYSYRASGEAFVTKAETRQGMEEDGIHVLLLHGFMGLYTFVNFLVRLPSAWTVSALRRGNVAKKMPKADIFPQYAANLRHAVLKNWKHGSPSPVGFHSISGVISDHLLLGVVGNEGAIPPYEKLKKSDQQLIDALRCGGLVHMATWAPSDVMHIEATSRSLAGHRKNDTALNFSGPETIYGLDENQHLRLLDFNEDRIRKSIKVLSVILKVPGSESVVNFLNLTVRLVMDRIDVQKRASTDQIPYALRLMGTRMIRKVSFYGLFKEVVAALHDPAVYQKRHMRALQAILEYDIPFISIIHEDDFMVSANRHQEEHDYLLARRMEKENVSSEEALSIPVRFVLATRDNPDGPPSDDTLNPHLMLMSTTRDGEKLSRLVTAAVTRFVNENVARATKSKQTKSLPSVRKWVKNNKPES